MSEAKLSLAMVRGETMGDGINNDQDALMTWKKLLEGRMKWVKGTRYMEIRVFVVSTQ